ncbi:MAG: hypothetical protein LPJ98_07320, partial [Cyclobacteriaceae bacterium]|nr:hypothetical protein [Cyclobacteriaceae bacterium]
MDILRNASIIHSVKIDESTMFTQQLMGEHKVEAQFIVPQPINLQLGDYIEIGSEKFYLNNPPEIQKQNNFTYRYSATFEGEVYRLFSKVFIHFGVGEFSYFGTPEMFMLLILENINSIDPGWTINEVEALPPKNIVFQNDSCRTALTKITEEFGVEYKLVQKEFTVKKAIGIPTIYNFEYGRGKGLYNLQRQNISNGGVVTRLYAFGGGKNLSFQYREGTRKLVFETGDPPKRYIERNVELFGLSEGIVDFPDIFPNRTGSVTSSSDKNRFIDTSIDFNLNEFLLEGTVAKVVFKSGALSGYEFEIRSFNNGTKEVVFNDFLDSNDYVLPNELNRPEEGDEYTFVDIRMPQVYIDAAENNLLEAAEEEILKLASPRVTYRLAVD